MPQKFIIRSLAALFVATLALAGCGDDDTNEAPSDDTDEGVEEGTEDDGNGALDGAEDGSEDDGNGADDG